MIRRLLLLLVLLSVARADDIPSAPSKNANEVGVAVLSHQPTPDPVEEKLRLYLGSLPGIDYLLEPDDPDDLFRMLAKLTRDGKMVRYLVIAGHGNAKAPNIKFRTKSLTASSVDMPMAQKRLLSTLELNRQENRLYENPSDSEAQVDVGRFVNSIREDWRPYHKKLADLSEVMAPDGVILLLNCSAAATPAGKDMCRSLGRVLLGKRGGSVIASTEDIQIDQAYTWFSLLGSPRTGKWVTAGDVWVSGNWTRLDIPAAPDPFLFAAFHPTSLRVARPGEMLQISPELDARPDSGTIQYSWNGGQLGNQSSCPIKVEDNPKHRIDVKVRVQDSQGRSAEDTFTVRVEGVQILGGERTRPGVALALKSSVAPPQKGLTYRWSLPGGPLGGQPELAFVQAKPGRYEVRLEVSNAKGKLGSDVKVVTVEAAAAPTTPAPEVKVEETSVLLSPAQLMVSDFFELSCKMPPALEARVKRYEWLVQVGQGEGVPATSQTPQVHLQLLREWVSSSFGVRAYDARGNEVAVAWVPMKNFTFRPAQFSFTRLSSWSLRRDQEGSITLTKEPTLKIQDRLQEAEGEASYHGDTGGGLIRIDWLSGDELRGLTEGGNLPGDWTVKGDIKQKGALAYRATFQLSGMLWPNSGGPRGGELAGRLVQRYQAAVTAHREYTASQAREILASLTVTPGGEIAVKPDSGPPAVPTGPSQAEQAADKVKEARQELAQGHLGSAIELAGQAAKLDPKGSRAALADLAAELKKKGWEAVLNGDFPGGRAAFQGALTLLPGDQEARAKLSALARAEKAWPNVQQLGQQVDELIQQRRLITAYPLLGEMIRLSNDLIYSGTDMHPYTEGVNRRYHARQAEWNQVLRDTSEANRHRYQVKDYRGVLDSIPSLEGWELSPADRILVKNLRLTAQRGLDQQTQDWALYSSVRGRLDNHQLAQAEMAGCRQKLGGTLAHFDSSDERFQKITALIEQLKVKPPGQTTGPATVRNTTSAGTTYAPGCQGDPFSGGRWNNARNGSDWLQNNFASTRRVGEIRIGRAGSDVTTDGSAIEIQLHTPNGNWVTVDRLQNTNINWDRLTGGGPAHSIPSYQKTISPPLLADAVRLNLTGNGWFVAENIQVLSASTTPSLPPRPPAASQPGQVTAILRNESSQNVHIFVEGDHFGPHNRLAPGEQRQLPIQLPANGRVRFQCGRNGQILGSAIWNGDSSRYPQVRFTREETLIILTGLR